MKREEQDELCKLSIACFGKPYEWCKLRRKGLLIGHDKESGHKRRTPLTVEQVKQYMIKTLEMQQKIQEEIAKESDDANRAVSDGTSDAGQTEARDDSGDSE